MKIFIWINAVVFILYGLGFMFFPTSLSQWITDTSPASDSGLVDMCATYGGMSLAFGLLLGVTTKTPDTYRLGVMAIILMMGSMVLGRTIGIFQVPAPNTIMYIYLVLEVLMLSVGWWLLSVKNV